VPPHFARPSTPLSGFGQLSIIPTTTLTTITPLITPSRSHAPTRGDFQTYATTLSSPPSHMAHTLAHRIGYRVTHTYTHIKIFTSASSYILGYRIVFLGSRRMRRLSTQRVLSPLSLHLSTPSNQPDLHRRVRCRPHRVRPRSSDCINHISLGLYPIVRLNIYACVVTLPMMTCCHSEYGKNGSSRTIVATILRNSALISTSYKYFLFPTTTSRRCPNITSTMFYLLSIEDQAWTMLFNNLSSHACVDSLVD
jgi:hypothetical protein